MTLDVDTGQHKHGVTTTDTKTQLVAITVKFVTPWRCVNLINISVSTRCPYLLKGKSQHK